MSPGSGFPVMATSAPCPCGSGNSYGACCAPLHRGEAEAATAEALMRSRYAAFCLGERGYLLRSWSAQTRPRSLELDPGQQWIGLRILRTVRGGGQDTLGTVEFRARYRRHGAEHEHHEVSAFVREDGRWVYREPLSLG